MCDSVNTSNCLYIKKKFSGEHAPEPPSDITQRDVFQHLLFSIIIPPPMFEHGFTPLM